MPTQQTRRLGNNYALALDTGSGTHLTMVYFYNLPGNDRNRAQEKVHNLAISFIKANGYNRDIQLEIGKHWGRRSLLVHGEIQEIQRELVNFFNDIGYVVDTSERAYTPHIDLRGHLKKDLKTTISLVDDWRTFNS